MREFSFDPEQPFSVLGEAFVCPSCGRSHALPVREIVIDESWPARLVEQLRKSFSKAAKMIVIADSRTVRIAGEQCHTALLNSRLKAELVIVPDPAPGLAPVCDDLTKARLEKEIGNADLLIGTGSGVISDLTKWLALDRDIPYLAVATAASMNGYASDNIAPTLRGVKSLVYGRGPMAIYAAPRTIAQAPAELTAAGFGDVIAKAVSVPDWRTNQLLFGEYLCELCLQLSEIAEEKAFNACGQVRDQAVNESSAKELLEALLLTGMAMSLAGTSAPASGGEHLISHTLDMMAAVDHQRHDLHGRQVGLGTIFTSALYERVMALESPTFIHPPDRLNHDFWGEYSDSIMPYWQAKCVKTAQALKLLADSPEPWRRWRATIKPMLRSPALVKRFLQDSGGACRLEDIGVTCEHFIQATLQARQMRDRFTILDLAWMTGILPGAAAEITDEYLNG